MSLWRTPNLTFRALEPSDDTFLHTQIDSHGDHFAISNPEIPRPQTLAETSATREAMQKGLVAVMICIPPSKSSLSHSSEEEEENDEKKKNSSEEKDATPIGYIVLSSNPKFRHHRFATIGLHILEEYQGKGYGREAICWILEFAFQNLGLHKVNIECFEHNPGALRLYERLGFVKEGFGREQWFFQGRFWGDVRLGMLENEWRELRKEGKL